MMELSNSRGNGEGIMAGSEKKQMEVRTVGKILLDKMDHKRKATAS